MTGLVVPRRVLAWCSTARRGMAPLDQCFLGFTRSLSRQGTVRRGLAGHVLAPLVIRSARPGKSWRGMAPLFSRLGRVRLVAVWQRLGSAGLGSPSHRGKARLVPAGLGGAGQGAARLGVAWLPLTRQGTVRPGRSRLVLARHVRARRGSARLGSPSLGLAWLPFARRHRRMVARIRRYTQTPLALRIGAYTRRRP